MTFQSPTASSSASELAAFQMIIEEIRRSLAGRLGSPFNTNPDSISFGSVATGSVIVTGSASVDPASDPNQVLNTAQTITASNTAIGGFSMVSSTYVANGFSSSSSTASSGVNLPLILGIAIPVSIIFVVVVAIVIVKVVRGKNQIGEKTVVKIENAGEPVPEEIHNDTANGLKM